VIRLQREQPNALLLAGVAVICLMVGLVTGASPKYGALAAIGIVFAAVVMANLTAGFVAFTSLSFLDLLSSNGSFSGTKLVGLILFASWVARLATRDRNELAEFVADNTALFVAMCALLVWSALSYFWAYSPATALSGTTRYALNMLLLPIGFAAVRTRRHVVWVLAAYVAGAAFSALYGLASPSAAGYTGRLTGSIGDPNAEATVCAASIPLVVGLMVWFRNSARVKLVGLIALGILFGGLFTSVSREGLVALAAVLVGAVIFGGRWRGRAAVLLVLGVVATGGYFFVLAPLSAQQRVTSADTSGRSDLWTVAWRVAQAHPLLGVGLDNFILVEGQYINKPGAVKALYIIVKPRVAHNAYLEALVDLGVPGLLALLAVLGCALSAAVRATWLFERAGNTEMEVIARATVLAVIAVFTSQLFVSSGYAKYLWLLLAVCPVLLSLARRSVERSAQS
jgi:O-antigen ligase